MILDAQIVFGRFDETVYGICHLFFAFVYGFGYLNLWACLRRRGVRLTLACRYFAHYAGRGWLWLIGDRWIVSKVLFWFCEHCSRVR